MDNPQQQLRRYCQEAAERRRALMAHMEPDSACILFAGQAQLRNGDCDYPFRPDSYFYYLTGFDEPGAFLLLRPGRAQGEVILFCPVRSALMVQWLGPCAGVGRACWAWGVEQAFALELAEAVLPHLLVGVQHLYGILSAEGGFAQAVHQWLAAVPKLHGGRSGMTPSVPHYHDVRPWLDEQRLQKSTQEIAYLRAAAEISAAGHCAAMQACQAGQPESALAGEFLAAVMRRGARYLAYPTIVGGGKNACILHYVENDQPLPEAGLVLVDAGAEMAYYAADITRTYPVSGRFSPAQAALYQCVLCAQEAVIAAVQPGVTWADLEHLAVTRLTQGLLDLGLLQSDLETLLSAQAYRPFYMHRVGHWLGLDVHDVGAVLVAGQSRPFVSGMVLTIEPGLYVSPQQAGVPDEFKGLGIRIEDDILVTDSGCEVLSAAVPKSIAAIEALMQGRVAQ